MLVIDKPAGWTSHDVVARVRGIVGTRRVGHSGTLDPMATGVLVVGIGRATRLLGHLAAADKDYQATIRLGWATVTDDAQGDRLAGAAAHDLDAAQVEAAVAGLTGQILQRPSAVSAIKVGGRRSHARVRAGEAVELPPRPVVVSRFDVLRVSREPDLGCTDLSVSVTCSSGTYIRALARDLGATLGVGGHLTTLRRSRVGCFDLAEATALEQLVDDLPLLDLAVVARRAFPSVSVTAADANAVRHGRSIHLGSNGVDAASSGADPAGLPGDPAAVLAMFAPDGEFLALGRPTAEGVTYLAVFSQP